MDDQINGLRLEGHGDMIQYRGRAMVSHWAASQGSITGGVQESITEVVRCSNIIVVAQVLGVRIFSSPGGEEYSQLLLILFLLN